MSGEKSYQKYIIITPAQLRRLRGEGSIMPQLDAQRAATLERAAGSAFSYEDYLNYQRALQKFMQRESHEDQSPLSLPIGRDETGNSATAATAAATAAAAAAAAAVPPPTSPSPFTPVARRTRRGGAARARGGTSAPHRAPRTPHQRVKNKTTPRLLPRVLSKGSPWLSYERSSDRR